MLWGLTSCQANHGGHTSTCIPSLTQHLPLPTHTPAHRPDDQPPYRGTLTWEVVGHAHKRFTHVAAAASSTQGLEVVVRNDAECAPLDTIKDKNRKDKKDKGKKHKKDTDKSRVR